MTDQISDELLPCPFCDAPPAWLKKEVGGRDAAFEPSLRALGCNNSKCRIQPHTKWRDTAEFRSGKGYISVNYDGEAIAAWNRRALPKADEPSEEEVTAQVFTYDHSPMGGGRYVTTISNDPPPPDLWCMVKKFTPAARTRSPVGEADLPPVPGGRVDPDDPDAGGDYVDPEQSPAPVQPSPGEVEGLINQLMNDSRYFGKSVSDATVIDNEKLAELLERAATALAALRAKTEDLEMSTVSAWESRNFWFQAAEEEHRKLEAAEATVAGLEALIEAQHGDVVSRTAKLLYEKDDRIRTVEAERDALRAKLRDMRAAIASPTPTSTDTPIYQQCDEPPKQEG